MTVDAEIEQHLNYAEELIREAESLYSGGKVENAAEKLHDAADELSRAGLDLTSGIPKETLEKCDSMPVRILRRVAEEADVLPDF
jgi:Archaeal PaREP1/PaREP8 family.